MAVSPRTANLRNNSPYMSVRDAVAELTASKQHAEEIRALGTVRLPPVWERVHSSPLQAARTLRSSGGLSPTRGRSPTFGSAAATPRRGDDEFGGFQVDIPVSLRRPTSPALRPTSPALTSPHRRPSTLNNASTFSYNAEPPYPQLTHPSNDAISVGSLSMLGSQALSHRHSSGAYGFGTSKRYGGEMTQYISPAHLKSRLCVDSPGPSMCAAAHRSGPPPDVGPQPTHLCPSAAPAGTRCSRASAARCSTSTAPRSPSPSDWRTVSTRTDASGTTTSRRARAPIASEGPCPRTAIFDPTHTHQGRAL